MIKNNNKDLNTNIVNKEKVEQENIINDLFVEFAQRGISKKLFFKVLQEIQGNRRIKNLKAYLRGALNKVVYHREYKSGNIVFEGTNPILYDWLNE